MRCWSRISHGQTRAPPDAIASLFVQLERGVPSLLLVYSPKRWKKNAGLAAM